MPSYTNTTPPTITGNRVVGGTINASVGTWTPTPQSFTYQWERADDTAGTNREVITSATGSTYTIDPLDTNKQLRVGVYPSTTGGTAVAARNVGAIRYTGGANDGPQAALTNFALVDLSAYRYNTDLAYVKANSSITKVIAYVDPTVATSGDAGANAGPTWNSIVSYEEALAHDIANPTDQWLIRNSGGTVLYDRVNTNDYLMNTGATTYQAVALTKLQTRLDLGVHFDGLFYDNFQPTYEFRARTAAQAAPVPGFINGASFGDTQWATAAVSFATNVSKHFKDLGYYIMANAAVSGDNDGTLSKAWYPQIGPTGGITGVMCEFWEEGPDQVLYYNPSGLAYDWHGYYDGWLTVPTAAEANNLEFWGAGYTSTTDTSKGVYLKAARLLGWNGSSGGFFPRATDSGGPWQTAWTQDIGVPLESKVTIGTSPTHGYRRYFSNGVVCVNPNNPALGSSMSFTFDKSYRNLAGTFVSGVTLAPRTAAILSAT